MHAENMDNKAGDISNFSSRSSVFDYTPIKLELSSTCNAKCIFCAMMRNKKKVKELITVENVNRFCELNKSWLPESGYMIEPFFNGESLVHPKFYDLIEMLVNFRFPLGDLDSNFAMKVEIERIVSLPWRSITVNIGGVSKKTHEKVMGTNFDAVVNNIKLLAKSIHRNFPLYIKMNPVADNLIELDQLPIFASTIGNGVKWKSQQTGIPVPLDLEDSERMALYKEIYSKAHSCYFRFEASQDDGYTLTPKNKRCIYQAPCINTDGSVTICAHDQLRHLACGDAFITPMKNIIESEIFIKNTEIGQNRMLPFCRGCN